MCAYFSKTENETSKALKRAAREANVSAKTHLEKMKVVAKTSSTKRECSVQEAFHLVTPEFRIGKTFQKALFLNSSIPGKRYKAFDSENYSQPAVLDNKLMESYHLEPRHNKTISLLSSDVNEEK